MSESATGRGSGSLVSDASTNDLVAELSKFQAPEMRRARSSHSNSSGMKQSPAGSPALSRRSSDSITRSRHGSEVLFQPLPFTESWQDTTQTQEDLMLNFRREVESIRDHVLTEDGVIEEDANESGESEEAKRDYNIAPKKREFLITKEDPPTPRHTSSKRDMNRLSSRSSKESRKSPSSQSARFFLYDPGRQVKIRDFAYHPTSPLHYGLPPSPSTPSISQRSSRALSDVSNSSDFVGRHARALYDFDAENPSEVSFKENDILWVQYRECPGWLVADVGDETGLIPENYIEWVDTLPE